MHRLWEWIKEHPYATGGLVLGAILLWYVLSRGSSSSAAQVSSNPGGVSDAAYAAQLAANAQGTQTQAAQNVQDTQTAAQLTALLAQYQTSQNQTQIAANAQANQTQAAADVAKTQTAAQLQASLAQTFGAIQLGQAQTSAAVTLGGIQEAGLENSNAAGVSIAGIQSGTQLGVAGIQGQVSIAQIQAALAATINTNAAGVTINASNNATSVTNTQSNNDAAVTINKSNNETSQFNTQANDNAAVAISAGNNAASEHNTDSNNNASITINGQNNVTQQLGISTAGAVDTHLIDTQGAIALNGQTIQAGLDATALIQIPTGLYNKGGEGGINQVTVLGEILGSPAAPISAAAAGNVGVAQNSGGNTPGGIIKGLADFAGQIGIGLLGISGFAPPVNVPTSVSSTINYPGIPSSPAATATV